MEESQMSTKERIIDEALTLFSQKGYHGTSVKNIADAVGIRDSSLYKHFKSKQEILNSIVKAIESHMEMTSRDYGLPTGDDFEQAAQIYGSFDEEMLVSFSRKIFLFYLKDSYMARFWRMGHMEQYQSPQVYALYHQLYLENSMSYQTTLFAHMQKRNMFPGVDPQVMAINFYSPIFFLLSKYAGKPEQEEEAINILEHQVREFCRIYMKKE